MGAEDYSLEECERQHGKRKLSLGLNSLCISFKRDEGAEAEALAPLNTKTSPLRRLLLLSPWPGGCGVKFLRG
jgi:hypothetical protein